MTPIDATILIVYLAAVLGMSIWFAVRQRSGNDYFLAGRSMGGTTLAASIMANQASAVSLVGAPAFVALRQGGGLRWLQYELALPLAMLALVALLLPALRSARGASIYEWIEESFGRETRRALAAAFLLSRGLAAGVILYASALVVAPVLGISVDAALLLTGLFSVLYCTLGGIVADIWSDVLQLAILWGGVAISSIYLLARYGRTLIDAIPTERTTTIVAGSFGIGDGNSFALAPMLVGGFFLYMSYYGCDQSQAQRLLTARDDRSATRALVLNGLLRFPLVVTYCVFGLLLAGLLRIDASFAAQMIGRPDDALVPTFLLGFLPTGIRGLLLAAIVAAAMSSIDSALNSLAAVTLDDVAGIEPARQSVWLGRATSLVWGLFAVGSALVFARGAKGVLELITQLGSVFYGPILGVFLLAALTRGIRHRAALGGLAAGFLANALLDRFVPTMSWLWWNPAGCAATILTAIAIHGRPFRIVIPPFPRRTAIVLAGAFAVIIAIVWVV